MSYLIVSTMKNEAPHLLEWLAYHKAIGFTDFLIYTNDCRDGTDFMLDRLADLGHVTHRRNKVLRRGPHKSALKAAVQEDIYKAADWVLVSDADEFLNIKAGDGQVSDLIAAYPDADAIPVTWRLFSNHGQTDMSHGPCLEIFLDAEPADPLPDEKGRFVKTLFRPDARIERLGLHAPAYADEETAGIRWGSQSVQHDKDADPRRPRERFGYDVAQMNRYAVRSVDAYLLKQDRGRANHVGETLGAQYWHRWNIGGVRDSSILDCVPAMTRERDALLQDGELAFLDRAGRALNEKRLAKLLDDPDTRALRAQLAGTGAPATVAPSLEIGAAVRTGSGHKDVISAMAANEALKVKAPGRHKKRQRVLETMPKGGRCAEIGVWNGGFSIEILNITRPGELVLIDPWDLLSEQSEEEWTHHQHKNSDFMADMFANVQSQYGAMDNVTIRKGFSAEVLGEFPDDYFDWVYIDGNHLYDFVKADVQLAHRKVRPGGIIAGDDFWWKKNGRSHVKDAVNDAMKACGIDKKRSFSRMGQQFIIKVEK